jgi:hypothetical protein
MKIKISLIIIIGVVLFSYSGFGTEGSDTLFHKFRNFIGKPQDLTKAYRLQIIGVITDGSKDSLEFVYHRIFPDTLRLQIRFGNEYAITVITHDSGWTVDPTRKIFEPAELFPEEVRRMRSNILNLFSFFDENLIQRFKSADLPSSDTAYVSFQIINTDNDTIRYYLQKANAVAFYKEIKFYQSPYVFKIYPKDFFVYEGIKIPRTLEIVASDKKKTKLVIVNIRYNPDFDKNLFFYRK